ncbi:unnamed protein product [Hymenolepis diminuta]|uniref:Tetraspanin n=2 Tax=Hymenolepis diminuta TaxID=6216 RepID=A0A0R3SAL0_HYMDI|nr:unnamed protein product [Hymenolepis diminuta]VUZ45292.1 unnamed protein product [Hymenolepis diminuta]
MGLTCGEQCLRILLVVCNLLVFLFSCVCAGFVAYFLAKVKEVTDDNSAIVTIAIVLAVVIFTLVFSFFGCCGAWKLNTCMLQTFAIIISVLLVIEIIISILVLVYHNKVKDYVTRYVKQLISNVEVSGIPEAEEVVRNLQEKLKCCGAAGPMDWRNPVRYCCPRDAIACQMTSIFQKGCVDTVYDYLKGHSVVAGVLVLVLAVVEIGAVVAACCLAKNRSA